MLYCNHKQTFARYITMKHTVLVTIPDGDVKDTFLTPDVKEYLEANFTVKYNPLGRAYTQDEYKKELLDADFALGSWGSPELNEYVLEGNDRFKMFAYTAGSLASCTTPAVWEKGVKVSGGNELFAESVAEATIVYIITALRGIYDDIFSIRNGGWKSPLVKDTRGIPDREIGIIGCGAVARHVMRLLQPFRCSFKVAADYTVDEAYLKSVNARQVTMEEVFSTCEIVSLHLSLTPQSRGTIGGKYFEMLPQNAVFVNTARGAILHEDEMTEVLKNRPDIKAVLDVFEKEPLPLDSELRTLPNVYCLPHRGGPTIDRRRYIGRAMIDELIRFEKGEPLKYEITAAAASRMTTGKK